MRVAEKFCRESAAAERLSLFFPAVAKRRKEGGGGGQEEASVLYTQTDQRVKNAAGQRHRAKGGWWWGCRRGEEVKTKLPSSWIHLSVRQIARPWLKSAVRLNSALPNTKLHRSPHPVRLNSDHKTFFQSRSAATELKATMRSTGSS